jgi:hypothetical protein
MSDWTPGKAGSLSQIMSVPPSWLGRVRFDLAVGQLIGFSGKVGVTATWMPVSVLLSGEAGGVSFVAAQRSGCQKHSGMREHPPDARKIRASQCIAP